LLQCISLHLTQSGHGTKKHNAVQQGGRQSWNSAAPADFGKLIADETEKWGKVIRAANIKAQ
jgi:hypothetical protein